MGPPLCIKAQALSAIPSPFPDWQVGWDYSHLTSLINMPHVSIQIYAYTYEALFIIIICLFIIFSAN